MNYTFDATTDVNIYDANEDWRVCPYEDNTRMCIGQGLYWNELACMCFYFDQCDITCDAGYELDPREPCTCVGSDTVRYTIFSQDSTDEEVAASVVQGIDNYLNTVEAEWFPPCNYEYDCAVEYGDDTWYWNDLICGCVVDHNMYQCDNDCDGIYRNPFEPCGCVDLQGLLDQFPSWAKLEDIESSIGWEWIEPEEDTERPVTPSTWDTCDIHVSDCGEAPLNELACLCLSEQQCPMQCDTDYFLDPFQLCECINWETYRVYFPDWATDDDILESENLMWEQKEFDDENGQPCDSRYEDCPCDPTTENCDDGAMYLITNFVALFAIFAVFMN